MFDLLGATAGLATQQQLQETATYFTACMVIMLELLEEHGIEIPNQEEWNNRIICYTAAVNQAIAGRKDEMDKQWREENPEQAKTVDFLKKMLGAE